MKILHVITSLRTGGAEKLVCDMLPLMRDQGHEVELAVFDGTPSHLLESVRQQGITTHAFGLGLKSAYNPQHINKLKSTIGGSTLSIHTTHQPSSSPRSPLHPGLRS
ncbi:MAG: hypothetical protein K2H17_06705 [Duncaniella sp.]|uniref:hypothetical protein n=1 Tax=Duncaniella sp. TaxID=2518496 RepID=UPI0023CBCE8B|nr:hypothetical protein [Duncaniella sp.]MDE5989070.1 hypothetical protein [Duncaniella sp.]